MKTITTHKSNLEARCNERGYSLESVMDCVVHKNGDMWTIDVKHPKYPNVKLESAPKRKIIPPEIGEGVGTELKKILSWFNIKANPNCSCYQKAKILNEKGPGWCRENISTIISWLQEESKKRNIPFFPYIAKKILTIAITRAERK